MALCVSSSLIFGAALILACRQSIPTFLPASSFSNCGNMGLPLALFAFGQQGLNLAIAYFAVHALFTFTIGQALAARRDDFGKRDASRGLQLHVRGAFRQPG